MHDQALDPLGWLYCNQQRFYQNQAKQTCRHRRFNEAARLSCLSWDFWQVWWFDEVQRCMGPPVTTFFSVAWSRCYWYGVKSTLSHGLIKRLLIGIQVCTIAEHRVWSPTWQNLLEQMRWNFFQYFSKGFWHKFDDWQSSAMHGSTRVNIFLIWSSCYWCGVESTLCHGLSKMLLIES